jgi:peptidoglycan/LPS O-acetylase OafA/YrhL
MRSPGSSERVFRADIQALRALAVTAVLLYHLWPDLLPGGYVGVDVFFVVSGFLITGQLFQEMRTTGRVGLLAFYARRIRRMLPAAFVVLACTLVVLVLVVPRVVWRENLVQMRAASAYLINWQLAHDRADYLAADSSPTLVQHYWSLAVEEQFYLVWPLLLVFALVLGTRRLHVGLRAALVTVLATTAVVSFAFAVVTTPADPEFGFFATQSRAWEFALGGLVAVAPAVRWSPHAGRLVGWAGVSLVLSACLLLSDETSFPGWATLLPTVGCALVLASGASKGRGSVAQVSDRAPVAWLGDHSYAVYLWHWPPIVALPWVLHGPLDDSTRLGILAATLVLAWLTKRYVEDPVRSGPAWQARRWASFGLATAGAAALVLATTVVWADYDRANEHVADRVIADVKDGRPCFGAAAMVDAGCGDRFAHPPQSVVDFAPADVSPALPRCQPSATSAPRPTWCRFGDVSSPRSTIALVGNSYAVQLVPLFRAWTRGRHVRILLAARTDCLGLNTVPVPGQSPTDPCLAWSAHVQARLLAIRNLSLVVFTGHESSDQYLTGQTAPTVAALAEARRNTVGRLRLLSGAGIPTLVVKHAPGTRPLSAPECVARSQESYDPCAKPRRPVTRMDLLSSLASRRPGLTEFLSLDRYFCTARECHAVIGGLVAYSDDHHISASYARTLAPFVAPRLHEAMRVRPTPARHGS